MTAPAIAERNERLIARALVKLGRVLCRHRSLLIAQRDDRLFLCCSECGHETRGVHVADRITHRLRRRPS